MENKVTRMQKTVYRVSSCRRIGYRINLYCFLKNYCFILLTRDYKNCLEQTISEFYKKKKKVNPQNDYIYLMATCQIGLQDVVISSNNVCLPLEKPIVLQFSSLQGWKYHSPNLVLKPTGLMESSHSTLEACTSICEKKMPQKRGR